LPPANYTTIVRGKGNTTGIALNEATSYSNQSATLLPLVTA